MIEWLNQNAGALTALLTLVYVVATLIILGVMVWANILTRRGIQTTVELERERSRPNVLVDMFPITFLPHLIVKNGGATPAYDVTFKIHPEPMSIRGVCGDKPNPANRWEAIPFLKTGIKSLAPGREVKAFMAPFRVLETKYESLVFTGEVRYCDHAGKVYVDPINIDLGFHQGIASYRPKEVGTELEKIHKAIDKFFSFQFRPLVRTIHDDEYHEREHKQFEEHKKLIEEKQKDVQPEDRQVSSEAAPTAPPEEPSS